VSLVWFTVAHGIFNEVFCARPDLPCTRDFGLVVTKGADFFPTKGMTPNIA
jgi:glucoamylase